MTPFIVSLTGPSCAGKTTLEKRLKEEGFVQVISHTTREPRAGEENGKAYHFIDKSEFKRLRDTGFFVETVHFNNNFYGVSAQEIERVAAEDKPIVVIVEPEGLLQIREYCHLHSWNLHSVFIDNPGEVIARRFLERMLGDFSLAIGKGGEAAKSVIETYSKRLGVMLKDECHWAEDVGPVCDTWLTNFNESNIDAVVEDLAQQAYDPSKFLLR
jgi:guanylate kinase